MHGLRNIQVIGRLAILVLWLQVARQHLGQVALRLHPQLGLRERALVSQLLDRKVWHGEWHGGERAAARLQVNGDHGRLGDGLRNVARDVPRLRLRAVREGEREVVGDGERDGAGPHVHANVDRLERANERNAAGLELIVRPCKRRLCVEEELNRLEAVGDGAIGANLREDGIGGDGLLGVATRRRVGYIHLAVLDLLGGGVAQIVLCQSLEHLDTVDRRVREDDRGLLVLDGQLTGQERPGGHPTSRIRHSRLARLHDGEHERLLHAVGAIVRVDAHERVRAAEIRPDVGVHLCRGLHLDERHDEATVLLRGLREVRVDLVRRLLWRGPQLLDLPDRLARRADAQLVALLLLRHRQL